MQDNLQIERKRTNVARFLNNAYIAKMLYIIYILHIVPNNVKYTYTIKGARAYAYVCSVSDNYVSGYQYMVYSLEKAYMGINGGVVPCTGRGDRYMVTYLELYSRRIINVAFIFNGSFHLYVCHYDKNKDD